MVIALTGHRPNKLGNEYNGVGPWSSRLRAEFGKVIKRIQPSYLVSGMALGADMLWAEAAIKHKIYFTAAIPFEGQELAWPLPSRKRYYEILNHPLCTSYVVSPGGYEVWKMQKRNEFMVDVCDILVAVFDGTDGGTGNCIRYAVKKKTKIIYINPYPF